MRKLSEASIRLVFVGLGLAFLSTGCRTTLSAVKRPPPVQVYIGEKSCSVYDFASATDVPEGAKNLGWVTVARAADDDQTFLKLREKICELGGDALSQPAWVHEANEYAANTLKANAWSLP